MPRGNGRTNRRGRGSRRRPAGNPRRRNPNRGIRGPDPPAVTFRRWNHQILETSITVSDGSLPRVITPEGITAQLRGDGVISTNDSIQLRFFDISFWNITGTPTVAAISDLRDVDAGRTPAALTNRLDFAGRNHWSHVHFRWPRPMTTIPIDGSSKFNIAVYSSGVTGETTFVFRVRLMWRQDEVVALSALLSRVNLTL